jgi:hypothetical protein
MAFTRSFATRSIQALVLASGFAMTPVLAAPASIDFDVDTGGNPIASGTDVANTYAAWGVTFACEGGGCGSSVYASSIQPAGFGSPPNVVTTSQPPSMSDINGQAHGRIRADLNADASMVCIDVLPIYDGIYLEISAYDAGDNLLDSIQSTTVATPQTICVTGTGIRRVRFPGTGDTDTEYGWFDNLEIDGGATAPVATPTLAEWGMFLLTVLLAGLAVFSLRRNGPAFSVTRRPRA